MVCGAAGVTLAAEPAGAAAGDEKASAPAQHFDILEYRVLGNSVLATRDIESQLYPLLGTGKTLADVESARAALEKLYHDAGFGTVYVDIPPQEVADGVVRLRVTQGRLERSEISGAHYFSEPEIKSRLPAAATGSVLNVQELQRELSAVNGESADRSVVPILKAGSTPGTVDLSLQVHDQLPLHGSLELNNQATIDTKPLRAIAGLSYADLFGELNTLALQYQATPQSFDQVRVIAASYSIHPLASGLQPSLFYINSNSNVATVGDIGVLGKGDILGARLGYVIESTTALSQALTLGIDYKHFSNTVTQNAVTALVTPISYVNLSLAYAGSWRGERSITALNLAADTGPRGLVNDSVAFANDRYKGRANYFYLRGDLSTTLKLPRDYSIRLRLAGQGAFEPIISNEAYAIAGADGVRGYLEAEELGDSAIKGTVQLQSAPITRHGLLLGDVYVFFDAGRMEVIDALPGEPGEAALRSWGVGLDLLPGQKATGSLTWARPLLDASTTRAGDSRFLFVLRGSF